jgi:hypothetical protein
MANIVQRITLEGAEAIRAQLRAIGVAGKDAFDQLSNTRGLNDRLSAAGVDLGKLTTNLKTFGTAAQQAGQSGVAFGNAVGSSLTRLTVIAGGLGLAFGKVVEVFKNVGAESEKLQQNADAAGLSTKAYESLTLALGQNGVGSDEAGKALDKTAKFLIAAKDQTDAYNKQVKKLNEEQRAGRIGVKEYNERLRDLNDGMGSAAKLAKDYNLRLTDASGELRNVRDFSLDFGEALKQSGRSAKDNAAALEVFGRAGRKIGQAFGQGREAIEILEERAQRLAPSLTEAAQKAVTGMDDAFDQLGQTAKSLQRELVSIFAGQVTGVVSDFTEAIANNRAAFVRFAETIRDEIRPALVDLVLFLGSPEFSLKLQGFIVGLRDGFISVVTAVRTVVIPAFQALLTFAGQVAEGINKIFGTKLTGGGVIAAAVILKVTGLFAVLTTGIGFTISAVNLLVKALPVLGQAFQVLFAIIRANPIAALGFAIGFLIVYIVQNFPQVREAIVAVFTTTVQLVQNLINALVAYFNTTIANIKNIWNALTSFFAGLWQGITDGAQAIWNGITAAAGAVVAAIIAVWTGITQFFTDLWAGVVAVFDTAWTAIKDGAQAVWDFIVSSVTAPFEKIKSVVADMYNFVKAKFDALIQTVKDFLSLSSSAGSSGGDAPQSNARGGLIRGRGTGTSDSILSWLSNREYVIKARAVAHYGPGLFNALNNMRLPKFASGGLVSAAQAITLPSIPRFAGGGPVTSGNSGGRGRPMVLQIGDQVIGGLTADDNAFDSLQRVAAQKSVRSAGRKPLWFKG